MSVLHPSRGGASTDIKCVQQSLLGIRMKTFRTGAMVSRVLPLVKVAVVSMLECAVYLSQRAELVNKIVSMTCCRWKGFLTI